MPTVTYLFNGTDTTHATERYSVRRMIYYWPVKNMVGRKVTKVTITIPLRARTTITTGYNMVIWSNMESSWVTTDSSKGLWKLRNDNTYYQYEGSIPSYYTISNYQTFVGDTLLFDGAVTLNVTGGEGNVLQTITVNIPADKQDINLWNGKDILVNWYDTSEQYNPDLLIGTNITGDIILTVQQSTTVKYWNGSSWISCIPYYWDGSSWIECGAQYYNGSAWVECDSG